MASFASRPLMTDTISLVVKKRFDRQGSGFAYNKLSVSVLVLLAESLVNTDAK